MEQTRYEALLASMEQAKEKLALIDSFELAIEPPEGSPGTFESEFTEGDTRETGLSVDGRMITAGAIEDWRVPSPLMLMTETGHGGIPGGAQLAGTVTEWERKGNTIIQRGFFAANDAGREAFDLIDSGTLDRWSPDLGNVDAEFEVTEVDEDGFAIDGVLKVLSAEGVGVTIVPIPALDSARIKILADADEEAEAVAAAAEDATEAGCDDCGAEDPGDVHRVHLVSTVVDALAAGGYVAPPLDWFTNPQLEAPTPVTVKDGRVFGHIAQWNVCHIGKPTGCTSAPKSRADYGYFLTGVVETADGTEVPVGQLTTDTGHAPITAGLTQTIEHYDHIGHAFADVNVGEDQHGIWVSGAVRPGVTDEQLAAARASAWSGDWRPVRGHLELVAVLAVNVPGFPMARTRLTASGEPGALVAAGAIPQVSPGEKRMRDFERRLGLIEAVAGQLAGRVADELAAAILPETSQEAIEALAASIIERGE